MRKTKKKATKGSPHPIRFDDIEKKLIQQLQDRTEPRMSVNDVIRRSVRFAAPKMLDGSVPITSLKPAEPVVAGT